MTGPAWTGADQEHELDVLACLAHNQNAYGIWDGTAATWAPLPPDQAA